MTNVVRPFMSSARPSWMRASLSLSSDEVASSRMRMRGSARMARAIATRWRWPPESLTPRSPTIVSYLSGSCSTNSSQRAIAAARRTCLASARPGARRRCSRRPCRRRGSCPGGRRRAACGSPRGARLERSLPSTRMRPRGRAVERRDEADDRALAGRRRARPGRSTVPGCAAKEIPCSTGDARLVLEGHVAELDAAVQARQRLPVVGRRRPRRARRGSRGCARARRSASVIWLPIETIWTTGPTSSPR